MAAALALCLAGGMAQGGEYERGPIGQGGQVFHASFDGEPAADAGVGFPEMHYRGHHKGNLRWEFSFVEGRLGKALDLGADRKASAYHKGRARNGEKACFKFQGHACTRVGTLSLWFRSRERVPEVEITTQNAERWHGLPWLRAEGREGALELSLLTRDYGRTPPIMVDMDGLIDRQWHHLALVWDERAGVEVTIDGECVASSWGEGAFHPGYLSLGRIGLEHAQFDELRVFDVALASEQIGRLARGLDLPVNLGTRGSGLREGHRLVHLGWDGAPDDAFIGLRGPTLVRRAELADARGTADLGLALIWYNGCESLTQLMREYMAGKPKLRGRTTSIPHLLYKQTGDERFVLAEGDVDLDPWWVRILDKKTIEPERLEELERLQFGLSVAQKLGWSNYQPLKKYVLWHYTRDKKTLVPALEMLWKLGIYGRYLYTETEQSGDRVAVHKNLTEFMYLGGMPGARAHLVPCFASDTTWRRVEKMPYGAATA
jgi:hypothetical protein